MKRLLIIASLPLLLLLLFSGCATRLSPLESEIDPQEKSFRWLKHQVAANAIQSWEIKGRLVVQNATETATVNLYWNQLASSYELRLVAPLWQGTYILKGSENVAVMEDPKNFILTATTPAELLYEVLGWQIHLEGLKYWIRGIPEPGVSYRQLLLDQKGHLLDMHQSGFDIHIARYTEKWGIALPEKMLIKHDDLQLKIVIQSWNI